LESIAYPKDKDSYEVRMPDGRDLIFHRKKDGSYQGVKHPAWTATLDQDIFLVKFRYGVELTYKAGRLWKLAYPKRPPNIFSYKDDRIDEITCGGATQLRAEYKKDKLILTVQGRRQHGRVDYEFPLVYVKEDDKLRTRMAGITIAGVPQKTFTYKNETPGTASMEYKAEAALLEQQWKNYKAGHPHDFDDEIRAMMPSLDHRFSWDTKTGYLKTKDHWVYTITPPEYKDGYAKIDRASTDKRHGKESWHKDERAGKEITLRSDGNMRERTWFTSGPLRGKEKLTREWSHGKLYYVTQSFYDENARLVRTHRKWEDGNYYSITQKFYDENSRLVRTHEENNGRIEDVAYLYDETNNVAAYVRNGKDIHETRPGGKTLGEEFVKNLSKKPRTRNQP
jgi:hypothetical protein